jgi:RimJ/RimL family protein N-acetyltransferase
MSQQTAVEETAHTTRDGRAFQVREARKEDAAALLRYAEALFAEPGLSLLASPGEFSKTLADEEEFIESHSGPNSLLLLAAAGEEVIGSLGFRGGTFARTGHAGTFGVAVAKPWRGVGVGSAMLQRLIAWAKEHPEIERIGMDVFETNPGALRLYRRFGFQEEGRHRAAIRLGDRRVDTIQMALVFPPKGHDRATP